MEQLSYPSTIDTYANHLREPVLMNDKVGWNQTLMSKTKHIWTVLCIDSEHKKSYIWTLSNKILSDLINLL